MFQSDKYIKSRHAQSSPDRLQYLQLLAQEYTTTQDLEAKQQVLANLANFAYDPINYDSLWEVYAADLFLDSLNQEDVLLQEFGMGGLANICLEPRHQYYLLSNPKHINSIVRYICEQPQHVTKNLMLNTLTTLILLLNPQTEQVILTDKLRQGLIKLKQESSNRETSQLSILILSDYYHEHQ